MKQYKAENERIKRQYLNWLRKAKGRSEKTIEVVERALWEHGELTSHCDLRKFTAKSAERLVQAILATKKSTKSRYRLLQHIRAFYEWLVGQPGYKSRVRPNDIEYLSLTRRDTQIALHRDLVDCPSIEYVMRLLRSIVVNDELDLRVRALIAFTFLSGMRDGAVASLPIGCFEPETMRISQLPERGVETKFSKPIYSVLFRIDEELTSYVLEWHRHLVDKRLFSFGDPLFPRTRIVFNKSTHLLEVSGVEPAFWKGSQAIRQILKNRAAAAGLKYYHPHTLRHSLVRIVKGRCKTIEELQALSQVLGHSHMATTLRSYGSLETERALQIAERL